MSSRAIFQHRKTNDTGRCRFPSTRSRSLRARPHWKFQLRQPFETRVERRTRFNRASFTRANGTEGRVRRQLTEELKGISTRLHRFGGGGEHSRPFALIIARTSSRVSRPEDVASVQHPRSRGTRLIVRDVSIIYHASSFPSFLERTLN